MVPLVLTHSHFSFPTHRADRMLVALSTKAVSTAGICDQTSSPIWIKCRGRPHFCDSKADHPSHYFATLKRLSLVEEPLQITIAVGFLALDHHSRKARNVEGAQTLKLQTLLAMAQQGACEYEKYLSRRDGPCPNKVYLIDRR